MANKLAFSDLEADLVECSSNAWDTLCARLDRADQTDQDLTELLERCADALESWPSTLQRTPPRRWVVERRDALLWLCHAPGGLLVDVAAGGGGLPHSGTTQIVDQEALADAIEVLVGHAAQDSCDPQPDVRLTAFSFGQVILEELDLRPFVSIVTDAGSWTLSELPDSLASDLMEVAVARHSDPNYSVHHNGPVLDARFQLVAAGLDLPDIIGAPDWDELDDLTILSKSGVFYEEVNRLCNEGRRNHPAHDFAEPSRDRRPQRPPRKLRPTRAPKLDAALADLCSATNPVAAMSAALAFLHASGVWIPQGARDHALDGVLAVLQTTGGRADHRARRLVTALGEYGTTREGAEETLTGLLVAGEFDLDAATRRLEGLVAAGELELRRHGAPAALSPIAAWALSKHRTVASAVAPFADALVEHPRVDELYADDDALVAVLRAAVG